MLSKTEIKALAAMFSNHWDDGGTFTKDEVFPKGGENLMERRGFTGLVKKGIIKARGRYDGKDEFTLDGEAAHLNYSHWYESVGWKTGEANALLD